MYKVIFSNAAKKQIKKLDRGVQILLIAWLEKNIEGCENPRNLGKALSANHRCKWRYRIGACRVLCEIVDEQVIVYVLEVGHRSRVYKN